MSSFTLTNTHTTDSAPPFIVAIAAVRLLAVPGSDVQPVPVLYQVRCD
jgi:hypothetical protein